MREAVELVAILSIDACRSHIRPDADDVVSQRERVFAVAKQGVPASVKQWRVTAQDSDAVYGLSRNMK